MRLRMAGWLALTVCVAGCGAHRAVSHAGAGASAGALSPSAARGRGIYADDCSQCHGADGSGNQIGPSLRRERTRRSSAQILSAILDPSPPMPKLSPAELSAQDVADVAAFVETL